MSYLYLDGEWNGYGGELISLALVAESGEHFYEVLECLDPIPWVAENVMPKLGQEPISVDEFRTRLQTFLTRHETMGAVNIVADWPEDIAYFCRFIVVGPGQRLSTPTLFFECHRVDPESTNPHNALSDAMALMEYMTSGPF